MKKDLPYCTNYTCSFHRYEDGYAFTISLQDIHHAVHIHAGKVYDFASIR